MSIQLQSLTKNAYRNRMTGLLLLIRFFPTKVSNFIGSVFPIDHSHRQLRISLKIWRQMEVHIMRPRLLVHKESSTINQSFGTRIQNALQLFILGSIDNSAKANEEVRYQVKPATTARLT